MYKYKSSLLVFLSLLAQTAFSQDAGAAGENTGRKSGKVLEEVVVTAQLREQSVQDVPISMSVVSGAEWKNSGMQNITDLQTVVPSLLVSVSNPPGASASFKIRGVGTSGQNAGLEGAVGFFLDGVYRARAGTAIGELLDIERIEVLRGPQGTLFGKNTSAGAIVVSTKPPSLNEHAGEVQFDIGNYNLRRVRGAFDLPLIEDKLGTRLSIGSSSAEGWMDDVSNPNKYNDTDSFNLRSHTMWVPNADVEFRLLADYAKSDTNCCLPVRLVAGPTQGIIDSLSAANGLGTVNPPRPESRRTSINSTPQTGVEDSGLSVHMDLNLDDMTLTAITAYRNWDEVQANDIDFTAADILNRPETTFSAETFSQELRLAGASDSFGLPLDWLAGVFVAKENIGRSNVFNWGAQAGTYFNQVFRTPVSLHPQGLATSEKFEQDSESWAAFTHGIFTLSEAMNLTLGLRYTAEDKDGNGQFAYGNPGVLGRTNPYDVSYSDSEFSGVANLQYSFSDDVMTFFTLSRGYKAGGINLDRSAAGTPATGQLDATFDPEYSVNYELGLKSQYWDGRAQLNLALFYTEFKDFQLNSFDGLRFTIINADGVRTKGAEVDLDIRPFDPVYVKLAVTHLNARYFRSVGPGGAGLPPLGGDPLSGASEWQGTIVLGFDQPISPALIANGRLEYSYRGDYFTSSSNAPQTLQQEYSLLAGRLGVASTDERWEASVYCRNCTDKVYSTTAFGAVVQPGSFDAFINQPREVGVSVTYRLAP